MVNLQSVYGLIPNVYGQGDAAHIVHKLATTLMEEENNKKSSLQHQIGHLVLIDRNVDYVTPLCSQVS